ncbi:MULTISPECIES: site-specific integrase [unclassified Caballeronia]|uniref:tyrosine-type recombinase/integrase n=1 Tax=unclassified Caballeronia TaxID=2646786 RepID=UPI002862A712|nr:MULTISPECIES: site-specific integrase [unclassified Caballeronia]MDR5777601.1 site-specific integrase [Caballeronia sp. LZ002]MDR5802357.1 site-specific integrase [Caballeronia sp. LZ001]MDR5853025.1 site-specific integrase [Caballeronia sp. LZ003]
MPIETVTKNGRKRYRWTFNRIIKGERIRQTKLLPLGVSSAEADGLARRWEAEIYAIANGERRPTVTIGECVRKHVVDKKDRWKDAEKRIRILQKWSAEYAEQDALDLHDWSIRIAASMRAARDHHGMTKRPLTDASIKNVLAYLRAAIKYAHKVGMLAEDQTARMVMPSVSNERHHYPQRREMLLIARACKHREVRAAIRIAFYSGMRKSEILRATVTKKGFALTDTKNGMPRIIPIHPRIAVLARNVRFTVSANVFGNHFESARAAAGFSKTRFHDLRHAAASEMINAGVDLFTVGGVLGHLSIVSTKRYSHLVTEKLANAIERIGSTK